MPTKKREFNFNDWYQIKHSKGWVTVLVQTNNPIYDNKQQNYNGVDHIGDELHDLRKKFSFLLFEYKRYILSLPLPQVFSLQIVQQIHRTSSKLCSVQHNVHKSKVMKGNGKRYTGLRARISIQKLHLHLLIWGNKRLVKLAKILLVLHIFHVNQLGRKVEVLHLLSFFNL